MIFSKQNAFIKVVIWAVVLAFVLSCFIFAGMFQHERSVSAQRQKEIDAADAKGKVGEADGAKALAKVNGTPVTAKDFFAFYGNLNQEMKNFYSTREKLVELLDKYVEIKLKDKKLADITVTPEATEREVKKFIEKQNFPNREEFVRALEARGLTIAKFENDFIRPTVQQQELMNQLVNPRDLTEKAVRDYFDAHKDKFKKETKAPDGSTLSVPMEFPECKATIEALLAADVTDEMLKNYFAKHGERWRAAPRADVAHILVRENEKKRLDKIQPTDAELAAYYQEVRHLKKFQTKESVTVRSLLVGRESPKVLEAVQLTTAEITTFYNEHIKEYTEPGFVEVQNLLVDATKIKAEPTDENLRAFYARRGVVDCRHILVAKDAETLAVELQRKLAALSNETLPVQLAEFAKLAKEHSTDPGSKDKGGEYKDVRRGAMVPPFDQAIFSLPVGEIGAPVKTDFGWHVIRVDAERGLWDKPYDACTDEVRAAFLKDEVDRLAKEKAENLRKEAKAGAAFDTLVKNSSDGPLAKTAPTFKIYLEPGPADEYKPEMSGEVAFGGSVIYGLRLALKDLKAGETSEPVKSLLGTHLLFAKARGEAKVRALETVRDEVVRRAKAAKAEPLVAARAEEAYRKLDRGLPIDQIVAEYSEDPNAKAGGKVGAVEPYGSAAGLPTAKGAISEDGATILPEISEALAKARVAGKPLPPVTTKLGSHVLFVDDIAVSVPRKFEEVRDLLRADYVKAKDADLTRKAADEVAKKLKDGAKFETLVKEYSDAPSAVNGGALGQFAKGELPQEPERKKQLRGEVMPNEWALLPEFSEAAFTLPVGKPSEIVKSALGYHVFLVTKREKGALPTFDDVKEKIRAIFAEKTVVAEKEIADYYAQNADDYKTPAKLRLKSITVDSEAEAKEVRRRVTEGKESFDAVAAQKSKDLATKDKGGDSGLVPEESLDPTLLAAVKKIETGKVSEPVKVSTGWVVAQLVESQPEKRTPLAEVRAEIVDRLLGPKKNAMFEEYIQELRNAAEIEWVPENFRLLEKYAVPGADRK